MYQRPTPNPYGDIEPTGNIFTDARRQFVQLFGDAPNSFSPFNPITRTYGEGGFHQHRDRFGQLFEEMQADMAEGMDLNQIREKYSQEPEARAYLNFQANYDPTQFAKDNPDLAERGTMNAKQAWKAALFTDKIDYNEPGGGFYQEQAEKFLPEGDDGRAPATIREYRDRERDDYIGQGGTLRGWMRREPIDPVAVQEREEARRASLTPERRLREDIQSGRVSMEDAREQYPDQFRQAEEMARQDRERLRAEGGIGSLRDRMRDRMGQQRQNRQLIRGQYQDLFGRRPDRAGEDYWMRSLQRGNITPENLRETLIAGANPKDLEYYQSQNVQPGFEDPGYNRPPPSQQPGGPVIVDDGPLRPKDPVDYGAADIGGGRPAPRPTYAPPRPMTPPPMTPPPTPVTIDDTGFYGPDMGGGMIASTDPVTGETTVGAGTFNPNAWIGTGPVDPIKALTNPYYRFTPKETLPPTLPTGGMEGGGYGGGMSPGKGGKGGGMSPGQTYQPYTPTQAEYDAIRATPPQVGTGPVDPMRALTDPYYRFTPATPPVAASLPPTPTPPAVEGNVLSEMPGPVNPIPFPAVTPVGVFEEYNTPAMQGPIDYVGQPVDSAGYPVYSQPPLGGMSPGVDAQTRAEILAEVMGGMSPGQTYQPYTPPGSGFGGYGGGMGGGMGGGAPAQTTEPEPEPADLDAELEKLVDGLDLDDLDFEAGDAPASKKAASKKAASKKAASKKAASKKAVKKKTAQTDADGNDPDEESEKETSQNVEVKDPDEESEDKKKKK